MKTTVLITAVLTGVLLAGCGKEWGMDAYTTIVPEGASMDGTYTINSKPKTVNVPVDNPANLQTIAEQQAQLDANAAELARLAAIIAAFQAGSDPDPDPTPVYSQKFKSLWLNGNEDPELAGQVLFSPCEPRAYMECSIRHKENYTSMASANGNTQWRANNLDRFGPGAVVTCTDKEGNDFYFAALAPKTTGSCPSLPGDSDVVNMGQQYHHFFPNGDGNADWAGKSTFMQCPQDKTKWEWCELDGVVSYAYAGVDPENGKPRHFWKLNSPETLEPDSFMLCGSGDVRVKYEIGKGRTGPHGLYGNCQ